MASGAFQFQLKTK